MLLEYILALYSNAKAVLDTFLAESSAILFLNDMDNTTTTTTDNLWNITNEYIDFKINTNTHSIFLDTFFFFLRFILKLFIMIL